MRGKDRLSAARRSWNMSRIRGKHTTPEMRVRSLLHRLGYRFRLHVRIPVAPIRNAELGTRNTLSASTGERDRVRCRKSDSALRTPRSALKSVCPDLILPKHRLAVFVHGCFWHRHPGCKNCTTPTARRDWWLAKLNGNAARDRLHQRALRQLGWRTLVVWECETEKLELLQRVEKKLLKALRNSVRPVPPRALRA